MREAAEKEERLYRPPSDTFALQLATQLQLYCGRSLCTVLLRRSSPDQLEGAEVDLPGARQLPLAGGRVAEDIEQLRGRARRVLAVPEQQRHLQRCLDIADI